MQVLGSVEEIEDADRLWKVAVHELFQSCTAIGQGNPLPSLIHAHLARLPA